MNTVPVLSTANKIGRPGVGLDGLGLIPSRTDVAPRFVVSIPLGPALMPGADCLAVFRYRKVPGVATPPLIHELNARCIQSSVERGRIEEALGRSPVPTRFRIASTTETGLQLESCPLLLSSTHLVFLQLKCRVWLKS